VNAPTPNPTLVRLERDDLCCSNIAEIHPGTKTHAAALRCAGCGKHRGWLPKVAMDFVTDLTSKFGCPAEPIIIRGSTEGDETMATRQYDDTNRGALFRDADKQKDGDRDYSGTINIDGTDYWLSAWIKTSAKGTKYMSLSVKPKDEKARGGPRKSVAEDLDDDLDDEIQF
jgi:hypothetical protein